MLMSKSKRVAELERRLAAIHAQEAERKREAIWAQFSDDEQKLALASMERREQPGYVLTAEDEAIERRWAEAVQAVVPAAYHWREWAVRFGEAVRAHR